MRTLYLTWDGPAQDYLESLFFPVLGGLGAHGISARVLQVTWASDERIERTRNAARAHAVEYDALRVSERYRLAGLPLWLGLAARRIRSICAEDAVSCLMPRSLLPAAMALLANGSGLRLPIVWDSDGLMADERVDFAGESPTSLPNRFLRRVELETLRRARAVITRTDRARDILRARAGAGFPSEKTFVIPNAKDPQQFQPLTPGRALEVRRRSGVDPEAPWLIYAGSIGPQYQVRAMLELFARIRHSRPTSRFHMLVYEPEALQSFDPALLEGVTALTVSPGEVPTYLGAADAGLALRSTTFSQRAVSPIKVIEYLMSGTPVVASPAGDIGRQLASDDVAYITDDLSGPDLDRAADWFLQRVLVDRDGFRQRARSLALREFSLPQSIARYADALRYGARRDGDSD